MKKGFSDSSPCKHCLILLKKVGIQRVYYSIFGDFKMEKVKYMKTEHISSRYRKPWSEFSNTSYCR